jgi:hypothetical protein
MLLILGKSIENYYVYIKIELGTAHYLLYRGRLRRNSTVIIFFSLPPS